MGYPPIISICRKVRYTTTYLGMITHGMMADGLQVLKYIAVISLTFGGRGVR